MTETIPQTKICNKCNMGKQFSEFHKQKHGKFGLNGRCKHCINEYCQDNKQSLAIARNKYYMANKSKFNEINNEHYRNNKEEINKRHREYSKTAKGKAIQRNSNHKRRINLNDGDVTTAQLVELYKNAKVCYWCNQPLKNKKLHLDHYVPLAKGGLHTISNLVISCDTCNRLKSAKDPLEFANSIGKLL